MNKYKKFLAVIIIIFLLSGCAAPKDVPNSSQKQNENTSKYLFEAKGIETIQLTGQEILDGKEADMSVKISEKVNMDFHISRDNPNGTKLYAIYNSNGYNLAVNYVSPDVFDNDEAIPTYHYQLSCYDFNKDGTKEVVVAAGNKEDELSIFIFGVNVKSQFLFDSENYILGYKSAYVNENNEICVPSPKGVKLYQYSMKAEDAEVAKLSGPIKITIDNVTEEQLKKYKNAKKFVKDKDAPSLLILPKETLKNVTIYSIEYDADTEKHKVSSVLYNIPKISPNEPLIVQAFLPDFPSLAISYVDASGTEQMCGILESLKDGTLYLFEMEQAKG